MVKKQLFVVFAFNALLWGMFTVVTITHGFQWWFFYLACGSMYGLYVMSSNPYYLIEERDAARDSFLNYLIYVVGWLPMLAVISHRTLLSAAHTPDEALRIIAEEAEQHE